MARIRILIADGDPAFLAGVRTTLEHDGGFDVVAETHDSRQLLALVGATDPQVILLDAQPETIVLLDEIRIRFPAVKVVICALTVDHPSLDEALAHGAAGYITKNVEPDELTLAIRGAVEGTQRGPPVLPAATAPSPVDRSLTRREREVMSAVAHGFSNKAIASELAISEQTVKFHLRNAYRKLGVSNRTEGAMWMLTHHLD